MKTQSAVTWNGEEVEEHESGDSWMRPTPIGTS
jgi:hypothetical protein